MKKTLLLVFLTVVSTSTVSAQITILESDFTAMFGAPIEATSYALDRTEVQAIVDASGPNQTWDVSGVTMTDTTTATIAYINLPAEIPGSTNPEFAEATVAQSVSAPGDTVQSYIYYSLENGELIRFGATAAGDLDGDGVLDEFSTFNAPPSVQEVFPIEFGNSWTDSTSVLFGSAPTPQAIELNETTVDGWGTLTTPDGSYDALRITSVDRSYNPLIPTFVTTVINIDLITPDGISLYITVDEDGQILDADLTVMGSMTGTGVEPASGERPREFQLAQNFPNPFNPSTRISYALPEASAVRLTVYTLTGQEVATLVDGTFAAGTYEVPFDGRDLASGIYLYRIQAGAFTETRVMSLLK